MPGIQLKIEAGVNGIQLEWRYHTNSRNDVLRVVEISEKEQITGGGS